MPGGRSRVLAAGPGSVPSAASRRFGGSAGLWCQITTWHRPAPLRHSTLSYASAGLRNSLVTSPLARS